MVKLNHRRIFLLETITTGRLTVEILQGSRRDHLFQCRHCGCPGGDFHFRSFTLLQLGGDEQGNHEGHTLIMEGLVRRMTPNSECFYLLLNRDQQLHCLKQPLYVSPSVSFIGPLLLTKYLLFKLTVTP